MACHLWLVVPALEHSNGDLYANLPCHYHLNFVTRYKKNLNLSKLPLESYCEQCRDISLQQIQMIHFQWMDHTLHHLVKPQDKDELSLCESQQVLQLSLNGHDCVGIEHSL